MVMVIPERNSDVALLRRMRREGRGPRFTRIGRLVRYPEDWLYKYIEANAVGPAQENNRK